MAVSQYDRRSKCSKSKNAAGKKWLQAKNAAGKKSKIAVG